MLFVNSISWLSMLCLPRGIHPLSLQSFSVLALESSANDTCTAVVTSSKQILSNVVIKQHSLFVFYQSCSSTFIISPSPCMKNSSLGRHRSTPAEYGWSSLTSNQHTIKHDRKPTAVQHALTEANMNVNGINGIAFTRGPGQHCLSYIWNNTCLIWFERYWRMPECQVKHCSLQHWTSH